MSSEEQEPKRAFYKDLEVFGSIGIELVLLVIIGLLGGNWLDKRFGTSPFILITGAIIGAIIGFYNFYKLILSLSDKEKEER